MHSRITTIVTLAIAALLALPAGAAAASLSGSVGPGFTITMSAPSAAGTATVTINDRSAEHNFHLSGPGVDRSTGVAFVGTQTWTVNFQAGSYRYQCDPHASSMNGGFTVAAASSAPVGGGSVDTTVTPSGELPRTSASTLPLVWLGLALVLLGAGLNLLAPRRFS